MILEAYPVFRKDFRILAKQLVAVLALQAVVMIGFYILVNTPEIYNKFLDYFKSALHDTRDWFPKIQIAISAVIALAAAAQWSVEERVGKHDLFLRRLAASRRRVWDEKAAAGVTILVATILFQWLWCAVAGLFGMEVWDPEEGIGLYIGIVTITSYLVGLPLSCVLSQSIGVVLIGLGIEFTGIWYHAVFVHKSFWSYGKNLLVALIIAVPFMAAFFADTVRLGGRITGTQENRSRLGVLIRKQIRENLLIYAVALILVGFGIIAIVFAPRGWWGRGPLIVTMLFCSAVLGVSTYRQSDKKGLGCVLYHHPISRSTLYLSKVLPGLIVAFVLVLVMVMAAIGHMKLDSETIWGLALLSVASLIPFCCGLLITHAFQRPLYAVLVTVSAALVSVLVLKYLIFHAEPFARWFMGEVKRPSEQFLPDRFPSSSLWPLTILLIGLVLAGWRAATDRTVLTGSTVFRQIYTIRLLLFVLAVAVIFVRTGWWDLFYLITGIDLGAG